MFQVMCFKGYLRLAATATSVLLVVILGSDILAAAGEGTTSSRGTWLAPGVEELPGLPMGPFVRLGDGSILTVDTASSAMQSPDEGKTWESRPIFADTAKYGSSGRICNMKSGYQGSAFRSWKQRSLR